VDGNLSTSGQLWRYVDRLRVYRDRLLHVDWRNRSILLKKVEKRWTFDLAALWASEPKADEVLKKALWTKGQYCLVKDSDLSEPAIAFRSHLTQVERSCRLVFEETGLDDVYLGFPFLVGKADAESFVRAPLILFPMRFVRSRKNGSPGWYAVFSEGQEPVVNRALVSALRKSCSINLPDDLQDRIDDMLESAPKDNLCAYLMEQMLIMFKGLEIPVAGANDHTPRPLVPVTLENMTSVLGESLHLEPLPILGSFPQGSTAIFRDYEEMIAKAERGEVDQGIIDDLLESPALRPASGIAEKKLDIDSVPDREINFALPTDASQDAVILESQDSECIVVRGPPGTGKSQVIVNLITNALAKDQRVLVVCQKRAALDVVQQRLDRAGLGEAAILLHDARADRQGVYALLARRMSGDPPRHDERLEREFLETSKAIDDTIAELNSIVKPMWDEYFGGARLQELYTSAEPGYSPRVEIGNLANRVTRSTLADMKEKLPKLQIGHYRFDAPASPVAKRRNFSTLDTNARFDVEASLTRMIANSTPQVLCYPSQPEQESALKDIENYERLRGRALKVLNPAWWRAKGTVNQLKAAHANDPRVASTETMRSSLQQGRQLLQSLAEMQRWMQVGGIEEVKRELNDAKALRARLERMRTAMNEFDKVQEYDQLRASLDPAGQEMFDLCVRALPIEEGSWSKIMEQEIIVRWIAFIERQNRQLAGDPFNRYLDLKKRLESLIEKRRELFQKRSAERMLMRARTPQLPPGNHSPNKKPETDWNHLLQEFNKKRRVKPVRKLMEEYPFQMMLVCPCWLVSPETASEVLPLQRGLFDQVIYDESSQLAVERALPSLYRAKRTLIAGDEKQLRPFDLFQSKDDPDEEVDEVVEAESLLILAMRCFTPKYLSWHYRSKYQELIDFSNHAFYEGRLEIAANLQRKFTVPPIEFVRVPGVWEERSNEPEGKKVVEIMHALLREGERKGKLPSLGVITFNETQKDLILDKVDALLDTDQDFERLYSQASSSDVALDSRPFVKNIENVQGDERDVIIFSVGYAPDRTGKMRVQFGSLNQEGGENRLNVAVTRAKERIVMVASFDPQALPVEGVKNLGPKRLKEYLVYAKAVSEARREDVRNLLSGLDPLTGSAETATYAPRRLEAEVKEALVAKGYQVDERVGFSGYKVDLAVVHPEDEGRYVIGVECDGATFHEARSARERDVTRQRFLEDRGWVIERLWARNWWRNRQGEIDRLAQRISVLSQASARPSGVAAERIGAMERKAKAAAVPEREAEELQDDEPESYPSEPQRGIPSGKDDRSMKFLFFKQLEANGSLADVNAAEALLDWADENGMRLWWREHHGTTTVTPYLKHKGVAHWFFSIRADAVVDLHFQYLKPPFDSIEARMELLKRLNATRKFSIPQEYIRGVRAVPLGLVHTDEGLGDFIRVLEWYAKEVKRA